MDSSSKSRNMTHLTTLPNEILHNIFQWMTPRDLGHLPRVCRALYAFVQGNQKLCHEIYLHILDEPPGNEKLDWETELHDLVRLENICKRPEVADKEEELGFVYDVVNRFLRHASSAGERLEFSRTQYASRNADLLKRLFKDDSNSVAFFQKSSLFDKLNKTQHRLVSKELQQKSAKLHCLYGKPVLKTGRTRSMRTSPLATSRLYDIRQYTERTRWGPFMNDGSDRVDWEKVEDILIVLGSNLQGKGLTRLFGDIWDNPFSGAWPNSFYSEPSEKVESSEPSEPSSLDLSDPYGVTGTWYRIVSFLDYNDFFSFNFPMGDIDRSDAPRAPFDAEQETRLIIMRIHVTSIEDAKPDSEYSQDLPIVHFRGLSRPLDNSWDENASSGIRGTVGLTREGEVRWTTVSVFHGHERWKSEGVQIGGVRSARGVVGHWFDRDYDPHGPCGPTAFWKANDSETANGSQGSIQAFAIPSDFLLWGTLVNMADSDPEGDLEYVAAEHEEEDDDDDSESEPVSGELPGLLLDAELEVIAFTHLPGDESS